MSRENRTQLSQALERRIIYGISAEWEKVILYVDGHHRAMLRKPRFSLEDMKGRLGKWSPDRREITLSRDLVLNHSWDAVIDVLKHEMAHQLSDEMFGGKEESPHGNAFKRACRLLRTAPRATAAYLPLDDLLKKAPVHEADPIMGKIKKLMALAESKNRFEAEIAMEKAHELIEKYNIALIRENQERRFTSVFLGQPALRRFRGAYHLAGLICDHYFVEGVWVSAYVATKGKMGRVLEISGTEKNIRIACYVYDFISRYMDRAWETYNKDGRFNRYRKTDFCVGLIQGFKKKLTRRDTSRREDKTADTTALACCEDPKLSTYMAHRYPRLRKFSRGASRVNPDILRDGEDVGRALVISMGITDREANGGIMIEPPHG